MLDTYKRLQAHGAIGPMMKVGTDGKTPVYDPSGELPGTLVQRPFQEYPKAVRRIKVLDDGTEQVLNFVAHSKSEELKIMSDTMDLSIPLSPLERERDQLAQDLSVQQQMNTKLAEQLENTLAKLNELSAKVEKLDVRANEKPAAGATPVPNKSAAPNAEALALANKKQ
jgi:chromosome segregation ATPase